MDSGAGAPSPDGVVGGQGSGTGTAAAYGAPLGWTGGGLAIISTGDTCGPPGAVSVLASGRWSLAATAEGGHADPHRQPQAGGEHGQQQVQDVGWCGGPDKLGQLGWAPARGCASPSRVRLQPRAGTSIRLR